jgi:hypothetical protein
MKHRGFVVDEGDGPVAGSGEGAQPLDLRGDGVTVVARLVHVEQVVVELDLTCRPQTTRASCRDTASDPRRRPPPLRGRRLRIHVGPVDRGRGERRPHDRLSDLRDQGGLLRAVCEARLGGEEEATPVLERSWFREVTAEADPVRKLGLVAAQARRVKASSGVLLDVIRTAAGSDPEIATLWSDIEAKLLRVQRAIVDQLDETKSLARGLTRREATDVLWTLNHPTVWQLLVPERRWSSSRYETWLHGAFCLHLLGTPGATADEVH